MWRLQSGEETRVANDRGLVSIQPDQEYFAFSCLGVPGDFFSTLAVVLQYSDANPPIAHRTAEAQDLCGLIAPGKPVGQRTRVAFVGEGADLHRPSSTLVERHRRTQHLQPALGHACLPYVGLLGSCQ